MKLGEISIIEEHIIYLETSANTYNVWKYGNMTFKQDDWLIELFPQGF